MKLTNKTFKTMVQALQKNYLNWELPDESVTNWKNILALAISDEFLPKVILDWMMTVTTPPKNPAEIIKHASEMVSKTYGSADTEANILIDSARNAYYATEDFESFAEEYSESFASMIGPSAQEAYIINSIRENSNSPSILILVFDEYKGALKDCFTGDAERGVEFLRTHIKKCWNTKSTETAKGFLISGKTDIGRLTGRNSGMLEA